MGGASGQSVDPSWKGAYKAGGIALIISAVLFFIFLYPALVLGTPTTGEGFLTQAGRTSLFGAEYSLAISSDCFAIPAGLALYLALKDARKTGMLVAVALWEIGIVLDLGRLFLGYSVSSLSAGYTAAASSQAQQAAYVAASDLAFGISWGAGVVAVTVLISISILIISWVMRNGIFSKGIAYLGIAASIIGLVGSPYSPALFSPEALVIPFLLSALLAEIWFILVGYKLYKLGS